MKEIERLETKINNKGKIESWSKFLCPFCLQEVVRRLSQGRNQKSCGCYKMNHSKNNKYGYKHGFSNSLLYKIYYGILQRCLNPNNKAYKNYGRRGITICPEWADNENGFISFMNWALSHGYQEGLTIDRINNDGNYEPNNCEWITRIKNTIKRSNVKLSLGKANEIRYLYATGNYTQKKLSIMYNIDYSMIWKIINNKSWENKIYE